MDSRQRMRSRRHPPSLGVETQARKGSNGITTSESSALNLSRGQSGRAACSVITTVQSADVHTKIPTELARASCSSLEGHAHAFFHTEWILMQNVVSFGLFLPANDSSWTKTVLHAAVSPAPLTPPSPQMIPHYC